MAVTQIYTAAPGDTITAARWNNEFGNIYNNGTTIAFPATTAVSLAGFTLTMDASGVTTLVSTASRGLVFTPGTKNGTPGNAGKTLEVVAQSVTDNNTAGSGTASTQAFTSFAQPTALSSNANVTLTNAATVYIANGPANGTNTTITNSLALWIDDGVLRTDGPLMGTVCPRMHISGLLWLGNVTDPVNDVDILEGECASDDAVATRRSMLLTSTLTKRIDAAWAVGTNQGGLDTGAVANNGYYIWLIQRPDTGVVDALFSLSSTAPTMPTSYTIKRLIAWISRAFGANVDQFKVYELAGGGIDYAWSVPTVDISLAATVTTTRRTDAIRVPLNVSVDALINVTIIDAAVSSFVLVSCPDETDSAPGADNCNMSIQTVSQLDAHRMYVRTSATGTIAVRANIATIDNYFVRTAGFRWARR